VTATGSIPTGDAASSSLELLVTRWPAIRPFLAVGAASIVAGGVTAAVTRPTGFELGSWMAAYLVLVAGVAQIALGVGQARLARDVPDRAEVRIELLSWNASVILTIVGTLVGAPVVTTLGALALVFALLRFLAGVRTPAAPSNVSLALFRIVLTIVAISTPVGIALAWIRHG
jgi:hypothetical protein